MLNIRQKQNLPTTLTVILEEKSRNLFEKATLNAVFLCFVESFTKWQIGSGWFNARQGSKVFSEKLIQKNIDKACFYVLLGWLKNRHIANSIIRSFIYNFPRGVWTYLHENLHYCYSVAVVCLTCFRCVFQEVNFW